MKSIGERAGGITGWLLLLVALSCPALATPQPGRDYLVTGAPTSEQAPQRHCTPGMQAKLTERVEIPAPPGGWSGAPQAIDVFNIFAGEVRAHHGDREICGRMHDARTRDSRFRAGVGMVVVPPAGNHEPIQVAWEKPLKPGWIPTVRIGAPSPVQQFDTARLLVRTACIAIAIALAFMALMGFLSTRDRVFFGYALLCAVSVLGQSVLSGLSGYPEPWLPADGQESRWLVAFSCVGSPILLYVMWLLVGGARFWPRTQRWLPWFTAGLCALALATAWLPTAGLSRLAIAMDFGFVLGCIVVFALGVALLRHQRADATAAIASVLPFLTMAAMDLADSGLLIEYRVEAVQLSITWFLTVSAYVLNLRLGQLRRQRDEMRALADTDELTGLPNRRAGLKRLEQHMRDARTTADSLAVGFLDIDLFKRINDVHGHEAGDRVLVAVAATLTAAVRDPADVIRMGGEEFLVLLPGIGGATARARLEAMRTQVSAAGSRLDIDGLAVTASIGLATLIADDADAASLLRRADEAMYRAKRAGRDRVVDAEAALDVEN
ncbi:diguanylate cyclase (GGDEF)-like protein [Pseudoxanthomonas japonensis]|uniref:GGDEF domain-containing protein n=1 Tax=Pseudoxanthomonas japonensis TaxID=69284 RepID=UPI002866CBA3|nr:diguanylate cyclase [Pseudoxanthomonas japonensis]MDR7069233.1 diguanylate cyclase (GGDEF)-like protein [Pseudoxanthomonas japonensis]